MSPENPITTTVDFDDRDAAGAEWASLAPLIAGRDTMRTTRRGTSAGYPAKWVRPLTPTHPKATTPAAVHLHNDGHGRILVLDLDAKTCTGTIAHHWAQLRALLLLEGIDSVSDVSPSGGYHVYIPLHEAIAHHDLYTWARRFRALFECIDPMPHSSADTGCIRPAGSPWKRHGYQRLIGPLEDAVRILTEGNPNTILDRLDALLPPAPADSTHTDVDHDEIPEDIRPSGAWMSPRMADIAVHGRFDTDRYNSPSEARFAVVREAARIGLSLTEVIRRMSTGVWPGLRSLYTTKYRHAWRRSLTRDLRKATALERAQRGAQTTVKIPDTSPNTGGHPSPVLLDDHAKLRQIEHHLTATELARYPGESGFEKRLLLRALLAAGHSSGRPTVSWGCRSLSLSTGLSRTRVAELLQLLCSEADPLLTQTKRAHGTEAHTYELRLPTAAPDRSPWSKGHRVTSLRPVFRELGPTAAFVYEALELHDITSVTALARATGLSRPTLYDVLALLESYGLISRSPNGWTVAGDHVLTDVAERLGILLVIAALVEHYRHERSAWHAWLRAQAEAHRERTLLARGGPPLTDEDYFRIFSAPYFVDRQRSETVPLSA